MAKFACKYCGLGPATYAHKGPHIGEWCSFCKRWIRWVPKREINTDCNTVEKELANNVKSVDDILRNIDYDSEVPWYD